MAKKSLGFKIKLAFLILLNGGEAPGKADFWTKLKMTIYMIAFVGIAGYSIQLGYNQGALDGFMLFLALSGGWVILVFLIQNPGALFGMWRGN